MERQPYINKKRGLANKENYKQCTAKSKSTGERCKNPAVGGYNVCRLHGARGGAPKNNKNAVITGEFESIFHETFKPGEEEFYEVLLARYNDKKFQLEEDLRMITVRERRMLLRLKELKPEDDYTSVTINNMKSQYTADGEVTVKQESNQDLINRIEDALTRVNAQKLKVREQLIRLEQLEKEGNLTEESIEVIITRNPVKTINIEDTDD